MLSPQLPTATWIGVDVLACWQAISVHSCRCGAEIERDGRNQSVTNNSYAAYLVLDSVPEWIVWPWH